MKINILMCGGRRTGKTSIMAAIESNVQEMFPKGDIILDMENTKDLGNFRTKQKILFGPESDERVTTLAEMGPTLEKSQYLCKSYLKNRKSKLDLNFIDVPGEWFISREHEEDIRKVIENSQVLIIAIDTPHMMEKEGEDRLYHDVYNRVNVITEKIKAALQGNRQRRMVLFAPLKIEKYRNSECMEEVFEAVKESYQELITYFTTGENANLYTVAVTPVVTMGGLRFLRFVQPLDDEGNPVCDQNGQPLKIIDVNPSSGRNEMQWPAEYLYLRDEYGDHYYKPENCEQPLIYILLFLIGISQQKVQNTLSNLWASFLKQPNRDILEACKDSLLEKKNGNMKEGFGILQDPTGILE